VDFNLSTLITDVLAEVRAESPKPSRPILALGKTAVKFFIPRFFRMLLNEYWSQLGDHELVPQSSQTYLARRFCR
jgi:hypothetical protein